MSTSTAAALRKPFLLAAMAAGAAGGSRLVAFVVLARLLGPEEFGRVAWVLGLAEFTATLATAGFSHAVTRFTAELAGTRGEEAARVLARSVFGVGLIAALVVGIGVAIWVGSTDATREDLVFPLLALHAFGAAAAFAPAWLQGLRDFRAASRLAATCGVVTVAFSVAGAWRLGAQGALAGFLFGLLPAAVFAADRLGRRGDLADGPTFVRALRFAGATWLATALGAITWGRVDVVLLGQQVNPGQVGAYASAIVYASLATQVGLLFRSAFLPTFTAAAGADERAEAYRVTTALLGTVILPCAALAAALAPALVPLLFGGDYGPDWPLFSALALASAVQVFAAGGALASSLERNRFVVGVSAASAVLFLVSCVFLIPRFGIGGAAVARIAAQWLSGLVGAVWITRTLRIGLPWRELLQLTFASAVAAAVAWMLLRQIGGLPGLVVSAVAGVGIHLLIAWRSPSFALLRGKGRGPT